MPKLKIGQDVIFIGLHVKVGVPQEKGNDNSKQKEELDQKIAVMKSCIAKAISEASKKPSYKDAVKIFVAPEFFFQTSYGASSVENEHMAIVVNELVTFLSDQSPELTDWLFVLGSTTEYELKDGNVSLTDSNALPCNFTPTIKFDSVGHGNIRYVLKRWTSHIDYGRSTKIMDGQNVNSSPTNELTHHDQSKITPTVKGIIDCGKAVVGVEVCLDHAEKVLQKTDGSDKVQIQILSSGGMSPVTAALVPKCQWLFNVDSLRGLNSTNKSGNGVRLCQWNPPKLQDKTTGYNDVCVDGVHVDTVFQSDSTKLNNKKQPWLRVYDPVTIQP
ncbi:hypothetical protein [Pseudoalteromonas luteoviolacea]|uniref:hypothetical protein n=1 Tax=Pseudoalteromonas luteoviolacea TaxID=43657 RepID=UPI001152E23A|nr:hypothetical protein [Pseudoalteromonas luteoviolacea]TQF70055.1 hypothetical protein FLM44_02880 [Pseudoalteromonas luteoviolacea]